MKTKYYIFIKSAGYVHVSCGLMEFSFGPSTLTTPLIILKNVTKISYNNDFVEKPVQISTVWGLLCMWIKIILRWCYKRFIGFLLARECLQEVSKKSVACVGPVPGLLYTTICD